MPGIVLAFRESQAGWLWCRRRPAGVDAHTGVCAWVRVDVWVGVDGVLPWGETLFFEKVCCQAGIESS